MAPLLQLTPKGLYCPAGDFYIDPSRGVENAVITHAHSDHARRGSRNYFCVDQSVRLLKSRLGAKIQTRAFAYGKSFTMGRARVSFHSAGHILGSAQVRIEVDGRVWVASGDYKREPDPTCAPFEPVRCDVFITEATFGTPSYRWKKRQTPLGAEILAWWKECAGRGENCVLYAYSLGKAQRVLGELNGYANQIVFTDPRVTELNDCYITEGVQFPEMRCISTLGVAEKLSGALVIAPPSVFSEKMLHALGKYKTAFASGWMAGANPFRQSAYDHGFTVSDHADWDALLSTIKESGAHEVYVQHRGSGALVRHLKKIPGMTAHPVEKLSLNELTEDSNARGQLQLF